MISKFRRRLLINAAKNNKITYPGLIAAWSAKGKSNDDADRAVLHDLTGNGHDITLNNFAFSEMSGYGGYNTNFQLNWSNTSGGTISSISKNKLIISSTNGGYGNSIIYTNDIINGMNIRVSNLTTGNIFIEDRVTSKNLITIAQDGIYTIPKGDGYNIKSIDKRELCNITIELLPKYPDALVFDGVDDYGINEEMPILTDYTIIVKRKNFEITSSQSYLITKSKDSVECITVENIRSSTNNMFLVNFGKYSTVPLYTENITFQTKSQYNNNRIQAGTTEDGNNFLIGARLSYNSKFYGAFYSAYLFERSLDEQEIKAFIRKYIDADYLLPSEIPAPDCYYDFTNGDNASETRDTIVDLSGNGNDAKAYNFAWNESGSGYKDGALQFDGTDDYISLEAFDSGFQTILMLCNYSTSKILYDQRNDEHQFSGDARFVIFAQGNSVAYNWGNVGGVTYINGKLNSSVLANETVLKKHCICINNPTVTSEFTTTPKIGGPSTITSTAYAKMSVFKFLGFKEALTEEQIQYVIKKYNLLDGVDEIEVS